MAITVLRSTASDIRRDGHSNDREGSRNDGIRGDLQLVCAGSTMLPFSAELVIQDPSFVVRLILSCSIKRKALAIAALNRRGSQISLVSR